MIDRAYCRTMARYNAWQNKMLWDVLQTMDEEALRHDAGLPQGSVVKTLNHLLWLDQMWLSRLFHVAPPKAAAKDAADLTPTLAAWWAERFRTDGGLRMWADTLASVDLTGQIAFWSLTTQGDVIVSRSVCAMHMFTQQTEVRARVRQVLASMGTTLPPAPLFMMPTD